MMNTEIFLLGLLIVSTFTSLVTEGIKQLLSEHNIPYYANTLVAVVSIVLSVAISAGYIVASGIEFTDRTAVAVISLVVLSWVCAMVGYDKVIQTIYQIKNPKKEG